MSGGSKESRSINGREDVNVREAALIAGMIGATNHPGRDAIVVGGGPAGSDVYHCLIGDMFNRYWEDGIDDYIREAVDRRDIDGSLDTVGRER